MKSINANKIPRQSCGAIGVGVMKSTIEHKRAKMGFFARVQFGKRMVIED